MSILKINKNNNEVKMTNNKKAVVFSDGKIKRFEKIVKQQTEEKKRELNRALDNKIDGLKDYRYHFCIENIKRDYWFTEKLIDCFVTGTIPIYWGCPSIGDFFNTEGMLIFDDITELPELLKQCTSEYYESKVEILKSNFELAKNYRLAELTIPSLLN